MDTDKLATTTREALLDAAERLFAQQGIGQASLREICTAAGAANKSAISYYFGDRDGLIRAVFERRLAQLETARSTLLQRLPLAEKGEIAPLLRVLLAPLAETFDAHGERSYAGFLRGIGYFEHGQNRRREFDHLAPFTQYLIGLLHQAVPMLGEALFWRRLDMACGVFLDSILYSANDVPIDDLVEDGLALAHAIMATPPGGAGAG